MDVSKDHDTKVERISALELVVTRTVNAPARLAWEAWTRAELFRRWWIPKSFGLNLVSCDMDVRVGGKYRLAFLHDGSTMEFFGTYLEVAPHSRLVWANEEGDAGTTVTTVTFEKNAGKTRLAIRNRYPSEQVLEADGSMGALPEALAQLDALLPTLGSRSETT